MSREYFHEYFREDKEYTRDLLKSRLKDNSELLAGVLKKLIDKGIVTVQGDITGILSLSEINWDRISWKIKFVGVIVIDYCIFNCYPKYIYSRETPKEELQQVLDVIGEYKKSKEYSMETVDDSSHDDSSNILPLMHWLMMDYYENGVYSNTRDIIEINGEGEILWDKTINETVAVISKGRPYYTDLITRKHVSDESDYCRRLHEYILTEISAELKDAELLDLLKLTEAELTDEKREDFGEDEYILYRIERELNTQFNTRKQMLLKNMYDYIAQKNTLYDRDGFTFLGVTDFEYVWEAVCARIMGDRRETKLEKLPPFLEDNGIKLHDDYKSKAGDKLKDLIKTPSWSNLSGVTVGSLRPDLIAIEKVNGRWNFLIFDAKYYAADVLAKADVLSEKEIKEQLKSLPGVPDITKQYLYQLAYQPFIREHGLKPGNCFLMPTEKMPEGNNEVVFGGNVSMKMLGQLLKQMLGEKLLDELRKDEKYKKRITDEMVVLQDIKVRFLPASVAYEYYLNGKRFNVARLELDSKK